MPFFRRSGSCGSIICLSISLSNVGFFKCESPEFHYSETLVFYNRESLDFARFAGNIVANVLTKAAGKQFIFLPLRWFISLIIVKNKLHCPALLVGQHMSIAIERKLHTGVSKKCTQSLDINIFFNCSCSKCVP